MKCDELKVHKAYNRWIDEEMPTPNDDLICNEVYLKSEADKVIAKLKEENEKLKATPEKIMKEVFDKCLIYPKEMVRLDDAYKLAVSLRKQKHKRCLAMTKWCESEAYIHEHGSEYDENLVAWFGKWYERWLKIAEQFNDKETK